MVSRWVGEERFHVTQNIYMHVLSIPLTYISFMQLAIAHEDCNISLRGSIDGDLPISFLSAHTASINVMRFNHDGSELASGDTSGQLLLWAVDSAAPVALFPHHSSVKSLAFNEVLRPAHRQVAVGLVDGSIWLWSITKKDETPKAIEGHTR